MSVWGSAEGGARGGQSACETSRLDPDGWLVRIECDTTEYDTPDANEEIDHCLTMREIRIEENACAI
jgi:hypothetical protein